MRLNLLARLSRSGWVAAAPLWTAAYLTVSNIALMTDAAACYASGPGWSTPYAPCPSSGGGGGGSSVPAYRAPAVRQPTRDELLTRQATALNNQGVSAYNRGNYREAMRLFELSLKVHSGAKAQENLAKTYNQLGIAYFNQKNFADAVQYFERANQNLPGNAVITSSLATARSQLESQRREAREKASLEQARRNIVGNVLNGTVAAPAAQPPTRVTVKTSAPISGAMDFMSAEAHSGSAGAIVDSSRHITPVVGATNPSGETAGFSNAAVPGPAAGAKTAECQGLFCTSSGPPTSKTDPAKSSAPRGTYQSAAHQAAAAAQPSGGCVFDGASGCSSGNSLVFSQPPQQRPRGSASLTLKTLELMMRSPEGRKLMEREMALQNKLAGAANKVDEIKRRKDAATDPAERGRLEVEYTNADAEKSQVAQQLYVAKDKVETQATQFVLDDDKK